MIFGKNWMYSHIGRNAEHRIFLHSDIISLCGESEDIQMAGAEYRSFTSLEHSVGRGSRLEGEDVEDSVPGEGAPDGLVPLGEPARLLQVEVADLGEQRLLPEKVAKGHVGLGRVEVTAGLHAGGAPQVVGRGRRPEAGEAAGAAGEAPRVAAASVVPLPEVGRVPAHVGVPVDRPRRLLLAFALALLRCLLH